ncbi:hypothetical protein O7626_24520 [Micromonospora sp. WMMD1102]|uniref:hypothetical protein n=1 Tax=Micromonospora sp. WMMD1102 TaxID=3016105 RepID=UPI0024152AB8|nr:hypothetical protein [Micromonospora sp. WMMD1102]MDG4789056.1 hypothetical protein [Micromonospora sp. WMMD1102]
MKLSPPWRKALLTLHVVTAVGWLGIDVVLLTLGVAGARGADPDLVYPAAALVGQAVFVPLSVLAWLVGLASALLTPWGLLRHRWVVVKLVITTVLVGAVLFALLPNLRAAELGAATPADARQGLLAAPIVSSTLLVVATVLSTYKPWGRTGRAAGSAGNGRAVRAPGRRRPARPAADPPAPGARPEPAGTRTGTAVRAPTG